MNLKCYERFYINYDTFIRQLSDILNIYMFNYGKDIILETGIKTIIEQIKNMEDKNKHQLITKFIYNTNKYWDKFKIKDKNYFINSVESIVNNAEYIKIIKSILDSKDKQGNPIVNSEVEQILWSFIHSFVKISIKYYRDELEDKSILSLDIDKYVKEWL